VLGSPREGGRQSFLADAVSILDGDVPRFSGLLALGDGGSVELLSR
jgi:hypothetical protein